MKKANYKYSNLKFIFGMSQNCLVMVLTENDTGSLDYDTFYCPVLGCKYNLNFGQPVKSFKTQKLLKQVSLIYIFSNVC